MIVTYFYTSLFNWECAFFVFFFFVFFFFVWETNFHYTQYRNFPYRRWLDLRYFHVACVKGGRKDGDYRINSSLSALEKQDCYLAQVKIYKMSCFVCHIASKITAYNAMPRWIVFFIKFFLNIGCNVLKRKGRINPSRSEPPFTLSSLVSPNLLNNYSLHLQFTMCTISHHTHNVCNKICLIYWCIPFLYCTFRGLEWHSRQHPAASPQTYQRS